MRPVRAAVCRRSEEWERGNGAHCGMEEGVRCGSCAGSAWAHPTQNSAPEARREVWPEKDPKRK